MDELVDILDENGNATGKTCLKSEAHANGWFHPTVHIWCYTPTGMVVLQRRGANKDTHPLLWDVSVAGHVGAGESLEEAAVRETQEEIGLSINPSELKKIGCFKSVHQHSETLIDKEFNHTFICEMQTSFFKLAKQDSEVEALDLFSLDHLKARVTSNHMDGFVPHDREYYETVIKAIEKNL